MTPGTIIDTRHGKMIMHYPDDYISQQLINTGEYEWYVVRLMSSICHNCNDGIILDIGANIGTISLPIAQMFPQLEVHSFEVQPKISNILRENIALNALKNIIVYNHGLGNYNGSVDIQQFDYSNTSNIGAFSLNPEVWKHSPDAHGTGETITVDIKKLDSIEFSSPIQCIKLDVEGFELSVLQGAVETLEKHNYPPVIYELWLYNRWWDSNRQQINDFLTNLGYSIAYHDDTAVAVKHK